MGTQIRCDEKKQELMSFYLLLSYELLGYFLGFVVNKSLHIEVFQTGLLYYWCFSCTPSYFMIWSKEI